MTVFKADKEELAPQKGLIRQSGTTSLAAAVTILSGLLLDAAIAATFGAGQATDAFFVAARLPVTSVTVLMVGVNQALVPLFSTWLVRRGEEATWRSVSHILTRAVLASFGVLGLVVVLAEPLVHVLAPGFSDEGIALAASLLRLVVVVVPLTIIAEVLRALLNSHRSFAGPAAMNAVLNGVAVAFVLLAPAPKVSIIAWGYIAGAACRVLYLVPMAYRHGFRFRPEIGRGDPDVGIALRLCVRPMAAAGLTPTVRVVEQMVASFLPPGSITILNYGHRLVWAVGGTVFFRSVVVTLVPRLSEAEANEDRAAVSRITGAGVRLMLAVSLPLTVLMATLAQPGVRLIFQRGNFDRAEATLLGLVLIVLSGALVGEALQRVLLTPFFAQLDMRTPLRNAVYGVGSNLVLLPLFVLPFAGEQRALLAMAAAFTVSEYVGPLHAWWRLRRDIGVPTIHTAATLRRLVPATLALLIVCLAMGSLLEIWSPHTSLQLMWRISAVGIGGLAVFAGALGATGRAARPHSGIVGDG